MDGGKNRVHPSQFQSTPSAWRVTSVVDVVDKFNEISIHTLRVEGDFSSVVLIIMQ